jgi:hypothetical protein
MPNCITDCGIVGGFCLVGGFNENINPGGTTWITLFGNQGTGFGSGITAGLIPKDCIASRLVFVTDVPPGVGESISVTINQLSTGTVLKATLTGNTHIQAQNLTDKVILNYPNDANFSIDASAGCACTNIQIGALLQI